MATFDTVWYTSFGNGSSTGYYAVAPWAATTTKTAGAIVRQLATPAVGSERCFVCIASTSGTGQTGGSEPTWVLTRGAKTTDSTVTWQECAGEAGVNGDKTNTPAWSNANIKNKAISLGQIITDVAKTILLICTTAGTTGNGAEPSWNAYTNAGATTTDNTVTWTNIGAVGNFSAWGAPHARCQNVVVSTWGASGNTFFFADNSAETIAANITGFTGIGTFALPCYFYSIDHTLTLPPTNASIKSGASIQVTTSSGGCLINICNSTTATWYFDGFTFSCGTGTATPTINFGNAKSDFVLDNCSLVLGGTGPGAINLGGSAQTNQKIRLNNTTASFAAAGQTITVLACDFEWKNTASALLGTMPAILFGATACQGTLSLKGLDLSALGANTIFGALNYCRGTMTDCKISSLSTIQAISGSSVPGGFVDMIRCDSSGTSYNFSRGNWDGTLTPETTIIRTTGASDGTTGISYKIATTANPTWVTPFESIQIAKWNLTTGSNVTVTLAGITTMAALPNNDDIWVELQYLGASGAPQASFVNNGKASGLASNAALPADTTSDWSSQAAAYQISHAYGSFTGVIKAGNATPQQIWFMASHSGTGTSGSSTTIFNGQADGAQVTDNAGANQIVWQAMTRFSLAVTASAPQPQLAGYMYATVKFAKASSTFYIDPKLV